VLARIGIGHAGRQDSGRFVSGVPRARNRRAKPLFLLPRRAFHTDSLTMLR